MEVQGRIHSQRGVRLWLSWILVAWATQLVGCASFKQDLYQWALAHERSAAGMQRHQLEVDGGSIAYLANEARPGQPTLVMIHGFAANKENWVRFSRYLTEDYHLVAIDLPGHGESFKDPTRRHRIEDQVESLREILGQLQLDKVSLIGNSMGGAIVARYAAAYPQQVETLILVDPAGIHDHDSELAEELRQGRNPLIVRSTEDFDRLMDFALERKPFIPWPITSVLAEQAVANESINARIFADIRETPTPENAFKEALTRIQAPTLILWGRQDRVIHADNAAVFDQLIPRSEVTVFDEVGHAPMIEIPEETAQRVRDIMGGD